MGKDHKVSKKYCVEIRVYGMAR